MRNKLRGRVRVQRQVRLSRYSLPSTKSTTQEPRTRGPDPRQWSRISALSLGPLKKDVLTVDVAVGPVDGTVVLPTILGEFVELIGQSDGSFWVDPIARVGRGSSKGNRVQGYNLVFPLLDFRRVLLILLALGRFGGRDGRE